MQHTVDDVACTLCGCVCDDLRITAAAGKITNADRACDMARAWYSTIGDKQPPVATIDGRPAPLDEAILHAAEILKASRAPLIYGLSRSSTKGQQAAVALADRLGATIDTTASLCHAPSIMAFQEAGESTCSLGEVRNRSDLVIYWGNDPLTSHPRHFERYSVDPVGEFVPRGRRDRTLVVVDAQPTASSAVADIFLQIEPGRDFEALWTLRALIAGKTIPPDANSGAPRDQLSALARRMTSCRSGVLFFGLGLSRQPLGHHAVEALLLLVRDLHHHTRFYARRMRVFGDVTGADSVLCWQTGFPFSVDLRRGYPRFNPGEFSALDLLERHEPDACLLVGSETLSQFSPAALAHLRSIPTIALDYPNTESPVPPTVRITTAIYGVHLPGTAYRMDEIPIPLRQVLESDYPSDHEVLDSLLTNCCDEI